MACQKAFRTLIYFKRCHSTFSNTSLLSNLPKNIESKWNDYSKKITSEYNDLNHKISSRLYTDEYSAKKLIDRLEEIRTVSELLLNLEEVNDQTRDLKAMLMDVTGENAEDNDAEDLNDLASFELNQQSRKKLALENQIIAQLLPAEQFDLCNRISFEISSGAGGQEAMLFAGELYQFYLDWCCTVRGWTASIDQMTRGSGSGVASGSAGVGGGGGGSDSPSDGVKYARLTIQGEDDVYRQMKFEGGVHRVQRTPRTDARNRVHTSTVAIAVIPLLVTVDDDVADKLVPPIRDADLAVETFRASGPGGQFVNKVNTAVRVRHLPTGMVEVCQESRLQQQNRSMAVERLRQRMVAAAVEREVSFRNESRRVQIANRDRSDKIRTYNYAQDRLTDHRIGRSWHGLKHLMEKRELQPIIDALQVEDQLDRLEKFFDAHT